MIETCRSKGSLTRYDAKALVLSLISVLSFQRALGTLDVL